MEKIESFFTLLVNTYINVMTEQFLKLRDWIPLDKIHWWMLSLNPAAIHLLEQNPDKIDWGWLSKNPAAIHLLEQNLDKIYWPWLSYNPAAIHLLEQNPDKIDWGRLSANTKAIHLLEQNPDKIIWNLLTVNPSIVTYNYKYIAKHRWPINKEIIQNRFHPKNMKYFSGWGIEEFDDYEE